MDVDETRVDKRIDTKYCDVKTADLDEALKLAEEAKERGEGLSIGLVGNAVDIHQAILEKGFKIDIITDQTSALTAKWICATRILCKKSESIA